MTDTDDRVRYDRENETLAWITLNRPDRRNALDEAGWRELGAALDRAEGEARVAAIRGAGPAFCAGDDIRSLVDLESGRDGERLGELLAEILFGLEQLSIPVVAAVDGPAYGGGCELVAACDLAVATEDATFALPETSVGAYPPYAAARPEAFGGKKPLSRMVYTGDPIDADGAVERGLVNETVSAGDLESTVADLADSVAETPAEATSLAKRRIRAGLTKHGDDRDLTVDGFARVATCESCTEAARRFFEDS
ncbi:enoyl-CoA hydratase/isomerase family protein [Halobacteriales archaeon Cl-PHB]